MFSFGDCFLCNVNLSKSLVFDAVWVCWETAETILTICQGWKMLWKSFCLIFWFFLKTWSPLWQPCWHFSHACLSSSTSFWVLLELTFLFVSSPLLEYIFPLDLCVYTPCLCWQLLWFLFRENWGLYQNQSNCIIHSQKECSSKKYCYSSCKRLYPLHQHDCRVCHHC